MPITLAMAPFQSAMVQQAAAQRRRPAAGAARDAREIRDRAPAIGIGLVFGFFVMLVVSTLFGMLGGLFGALMFRKNQPPVIPPPIPPNRFHRIPGTEAPGTSALHRSAPAAEP